MIMSLEIWTGPGGGKDFTRRDGIFFLENSDRLFPVGLFREASWEMFQLMILGFVFFRKRAFRNRFRPMCVGRETGPCFGSGF